VSILKLIITADPNDLKPGWRMQKKLQEEAAKGEGKK
jgi:hypothetical protein